MVKRGCRCRVLGLARVFCPGAGVSLLFSPTSANSSRAMVAARLAGSGIAISFTRRGGRGILAGPHPRGRSRRQYVTSVLFSLLYRGAKCVPG